MSKVKSGTMSSWAVAAISYLHSAVQCIDKAEAAQSQMDDIEGPGSREWEIIREKVTWVEASMRMANDHPGMLEQHHDREDADTKIECDMVLNGPHTVCNAMTELLKYDLFMQLKEWHGPAGGNRLVTIMGKRTDIERWLTEAYLSDPSEVDMYFEDKTKVCTCDMKDMDGTRYTGDCPRHDTRKSMDEGG